MDLNMVLFLVGAFVVNALVFGGVSAVYFADKHRGDRGRSRAESPATALATARAQAAPARAEAPASARLRRPTPHDRDRFRAAYAGP